MASEGPNSAGTGADDASTGTLVWGNPGNITTSNDVRAITSTFAVSRATHYLKATNFSFSIPAGATIDGIVAEFERRRTIGPVSTNNVKIVKAGSIGAQNKSAGASWTTTDTYFSYGSSSDLWGETWTAAQINASNFGVVISAQLNDPMGFGVTAEVDHIRITVYYTEATGTNMQINIGDAWKAVPAMKINIGDAWKNVLSAKINIGDAWKTIF